MRKKWLIVFGAIIFGVFVFTIWQFEKKTKPAEPLIAPTPVPTPVPIDIPSAGVILQSPGDKKLLPPTSHIFQTFNNCGPANISMTLSFYGIKKTQKEIADEIRPIQHPKGKNDDKTVFPKEIVNYLKKFGLEAKYRVNGDVDLLKIFISNEIPVIVKTWLKKGGDMGHYRLIRGFGKTKRLFKEVEVLIIDDSYFGPNHKINYELFDSVWQPFNRAYIPVYKKEKEEVVREILGENWDEKIMYQEAVNRAKKDNNWFNLGTSYFALGEYGKAKEAFEKSREIGWPKRMVWYQIEPIKTYNKLGEYDQVFEMIQEVFESGNPVFSELYYERGLAYLALGEKEKAKSEFELALKYNKNFSPAKEALGKP